MTYFLKMIYFYLSKKIKLLLRFFFSVVSVLIEIGTRVVERKIILNKLKGTNKKILSFVSELTDIDSRLVQLIENTLCFKKKVCVLLNNFFKIFC